MCSPLWVMVAGMGRVVQGREVQGREEMGR
jgi:hypothetical protein